MEATYETKLNEEIETITETVEKKVNSYITYIAEEWLEENQIAIDTGLRTEITEDFIKGLKNLFSEHYIEVPDEKYDVLAGLQSQVEELTNKLNEEIEKNVDLKKSTEDAEKTAVFAQVTEGLATTQVERLRTLTEGFEFDGAVEYSRKLRTVKESITAKPATQSTGILTEETEAVDLDALYESETVTNLDPTIKSYADAISRTKR